MKTVTLFVYGTLKSGNVNHNKLVEVADTKEDSTIKGFTIAYYHGLPYAIKSSEDEITGEKYKIPLRLLSRIDKIEEYNRHSDYSMYRRILTMDTSGDLVFLYVGAEFFEATTNNT